MAPSFFGSSSDEVDLPFDWSPKFIRAPEAWDLTPAPGGRSRGAGIRVGHPDSGFLDHDELWDPSSGRPNRVLADEGFDFVDDDAFAKDDSGTHGLGTASAIMSADNRGSEPRSVTGVAPEAFLIPYRVTKPRGPIPAPVLFRGGVRRLRDAIYRAVDSDCHVISISLG